MRLGEVGLFRAQLLSVCELNRSVTVGKKQFQFLFMAFFFDQHFRIRREKKEEEKRNGWSQLWIVIVRRANHNNNNNQICLSVLFIVYEW